MLNPVHLVLLCEITVRVESPCLPGLHVLFVFFAAQSEDHVSEVEEAMMAQCADRLQQEACKELFKDCTK